MFDVSMDEFPERFRITSDFSELKDLELEGSVVSVGFRPSGSLHVGNLLSIVYAAVIAEELGLSLDVFCCDTDWSAPVPEQNKPDNSDVMKLFFNRDCPCGMHSDLPEHRIEELEDFLTGLENCTGEKVKIQRLTELRNDEGYLSSLRTVLENMQEFDSFFGGGFRRRYRSPVTTTCDECGFSHAKGCDYSSDSGELVASCRNKECENTFMTGKLTGEIGVHYLVDPVRDKSRDAAVHVFGGDYRDAKKGRKTSKIEKVAKITELANGSTPIYFLGPMISDEDGKPLSKTGGTGVTVSEIDNLEEFGEELFAKVSDWIKTERKYLPQSDIL